MRQVSTTGIAALGISFLMISGNLDFSTGQVYAFVGTLAAFLYSVGIPIWLAMLIGVAGRHRAVLPELLGIGPLCNQPSGHLHGGGNCGERPSAASSPRIRRSMVCRTASNGWARAICSTSSPISTLIFLALAVLVSFVLRRTYLGRYLFAVGGSEDVARLSGINVTKIKYIASIIAGFLVGVAGLVCMSPHLLGQPVRGRLPQHRRDLRGAPGRRFGDRGGTGKTSGIVTGVIIIGTLSR